MNSPLLTGVFAWISQTALPQTYFIDIIFLPDLPVGLLV